GRASLVGSGPGDPDQLTMPALRAMNLADVLLVDAGVAPQVLALARKDAPRDTAPDDPRAAAACVRDHADAGRHVGWLRPGGSSRADRVAADPAAVTAPRHAARSAPGPPRAMPPLRDGTPRGDQLAQFGFQLRDALGQRAGRVGIDVHQAVEQFRQPQQALAVPAHVERVAAAAQFARLRLPAAALVELAQRQAQARGDAQVGVAPRRAGAAHGLGPGLEAAARPEALAVV